MRRKLVFEKLFLAYFLLITVAFAQTGSIFAQEAKRETPQQVFLKQKGCDKGLIVNADDMGRTKWSNEAVIIGFRDGVVTSTSLMPADLSAKEAYEIAKKNPHLDIGVHLTLARDDTPGYEYGPLSPVDKVKHLVDSNGWFFTSINPLATVPQSEMAAELEAQVKAAYDYGIDVTHLDCHKGFYHTFDKKSVSLAIKLAKQYDLPLRWMGRANDPDLVKNGIIVTDSLTMSNGKESFDDRKKHFIENISKIKSGTILEYVIHPATGGYVEDEARMRQEELKLALDPDVKKAVEDNNVCLIGYSELRDFQRELRKQNDAGK